MLHTLANGRVRDYYILSHPRVSSSIKPGNFYFYFRLGLLSPVDLAGQQKPSCSGEPPPPPPSPQPGWTGSGLSEDCAVVLVASAARTRAASLILPYEGHGGGHSSKAVP